MASRYERYRTNNETNNSSKRTNRNSKLYKSIYEDTEYSNIEGIASIEKDNEVNFNKIKEMLKNHEENKSRRQYDIIKPSIKEEEEDFFDEQKDYDIRDILSKAKEDYEEDNKTRSIDYEKYDIDLTRRRKKTLNNLEKEEQELEDLIKSFTMSGVSTTGTYDLLADLKGSEKTKVVANKEVINDALKEAYEKEIDDTFYTTSIGLKQQDFADLKEVSQNMRKNNILIIVILIILFAFIIGVGIYFGLKSF